MNKEKCISLSECLKENKAIQIYCLDIKPHNTFTDYIIIATASSSPHQKALSNLIIEKAKTLNIKPINSIEKSNPWIIIDLNFIVVHLFLKKAREFYKLEKIWETGKIIYNDKKIKIGE